MFDRKLYIYIHNNIYHIKLLVSSDPSRLFLDPLKFLVLEHIRVFHRSLGKFIAPFGI